MERFERVGSFMCRDGLAKQRGKRSQCRKKACFVASDQSFLKDLLFDLSKANDCFEVKFSPTARDGMYLGFCQFTNDVAVGDLWAQYESHPKVWIVIHDEDFCESYRSRIRTYT